MATRPDYDSDPDRFRLASKLTATYLRPGISLYEKIAGLLAERGAQQVLDLGCGEGALGAAVDHLSGQAKPLVVGLDASATMLSAAPTPAVRADATAIPFQDNAFDAVVAVNVLDHLPDALPALRAAPGYCDPAECSSLARSAATTRPSPGGAGVAPGTDTLRCRGRTRHRGVGLR